MYSERFHPEANNAPFASSQYKESTTGLLRSASLIPCPPPACQLTSYQPDQFQYMRKILLLISVFSLPLLAFPVGTIVWFNSEARLEIETPSISLSPLLFSPSSPPWTRTKVRQSREAAPEPGKPAHFSISLPKDAGGGTLRGVAIFTPTAEGSLTCRYEFTPERNVKLDTLAISSAIPIKLLAGRAWKTNTASGIFPDKNGRPTLLSGENKSLEITLDSGALKFEMPDGMSVMLQDDRRWAVQNFLLHIGFTDPLEIEAGKTRVVEFTLSGAQPLTVRPDMPIVLAADAEWAPLPNVELDIQPDSALDFSKQGWHDAPAGKHGYVLAKGPNFEFEKTPGKKQRFVGVNLSFDGNVPPVEHAERFADRLMRLGYNAIRIHHYETPLLKGSPDSTTLNPEAMARFDFFMAELIKRGIYLSTDLYVSRNVTWKEIGEDKPGTIEMQEFKSLLYVHKGAQENFKTFARNFLTHVNPHTGRSYAQEPALSWISIVNEGNFSNIPKFLEHPLWRTAWAKWITDKQAIDPAFVGIPDSLSTDFNVNTGGKHLAAFQIFLAETEGNFVRKWSAFLRDELKCLALVSNQNGWGKLNVADHLPRATTYDYIDEHTYADHPIYLWRPSRNAFALANTNPIINDLTAGRDTSFVRHLDKPLTISEWNYCRPSKRRGLGGILMGGFAAQQDWAGLWRYSYSHASDMDDAFTPRSFDIIGDPLGQASERAVLTLFMRGDLEPHTNTVAIHFKSDELTTPREKAFPWPEPPGWRPIHQKAKGGIRLNSPAFVRDNETIIPFGQAYTIGRLNLSQYPEPSLKLNHPADGQMTIDTPRTAGGFSEKGAIQVGTLRFDVGEVAATVWVSSLDKAPITSSNRLLLSHLTDLQYTGAKYTNRSNTVLLNWGTLPHLVRIGRAEISLTLDNPEKYAVYALATSGRRLSRITASASEGTLSFTADVAHPDGAVMLYEIVRE